jgi:hypothetical protein
VENKKFDELTPIITCLYNQKGHLPFELELLLKDLLSKEGVPYKLRRILEWIVYSKIIRKYMKVNDVKLSENYDEKGYLVTQSELLSGGVRSDQISFFSD